MKIILFLSLSCLAHAGILRIRWDAQERCTYRIWRGIDVLAEVSTNRAEVSVSDTQDTTLTVTAQRDNIESEHSDPLTVMPIIIQESQDLIAWTPLQVIYVIRQENNFFRIKLPN